MNRIIELLAKNPTDYMRAEIPTLLRSLLYVVVFGLSAALIFVNLSNYPKISGWDEGIFLEFSGNLAEHGQLATLNGDTFEHLSPTLSVGPTLFLPVSFVLSMFGENLLAARLVVAIYLLIATVGVYFLTSLLFDRRVGLACVPLFLLAGHIEFTTLALGRQVIGESPMLAFFIWGLWAWIKGWHALNKWPWLLLSTALFALAVITKGQLLLLLVPAFLAIAALDLLYYRSLDWYQRLVPMFGTVAGYVLCWMLWIPTLADDASRVVFLENQAAMTQAFLTLSPWRLRLNAGYFYNTQQWWVMAAVPYVLWLSRKQTLQGLGHVLFPLLACIALAIYLTVHVPWGRYAQAPLMFGVFCLAVTIADLAVRLGRRREWRPAMVTATWLVVVTLVVVPYLLPKVELVLNTNDSSTETFVALLEEHVPEDEDILHWEWEIKFYSEREYVQPPYSLFVFMFDEVYNRRYHQVLNEPRIPEGITYIVEGPAAWNMRLWTKDLETIPHSVVVEVGDYKLYRLEQSQ